MSKDRARPFSRKHRRYWLPVTGGMLLICAINVAIGFCIYDPPTNKTERIELELPPAGSTAPRAKQQGDNIFDLGLGEIPAPVMRAFAIAYPRHVPSGARRVSDGSNAATYELVFADGSAGTRTIAYRADGTFIAER